MIFFRIGKSYVFRVVFHTKLCKRCVCVCVLFCFLFCFVLFCFVFVFLKYYVAYLGQFCVCRPYVCVFFFFFFFFFIDFVFKSSNKLCLGVKLLHNYLFRIEKGKKNTCLGC